MWRYGDAVKCSSNTYGVLSAFVFGRVHGVVARLTPSKTENTNTCAHMHAHIHIYTRTHTHTHTHTHTLRVLYAYIFRIYKHRHS